MTSGGNGKQYHNHQQFVWQCQDREQVAQVLDILDSSQFQTKKRREIEIMRKAIEIMRQRRYAYTNEARQQLVKLKEELSKTRTFSD